MYRVVVLIGFTIFLWSVAEVADAARVATPPSYELRAKAHYKMATATLTTMKGTIARFEITKTHFGSDLPDTIHLPLDDQTANRLSGGHEYLIAFTQHDQSKFPPQTELVEVQPRMLRSLTAGEGITSASDKAVAVMTGSLAEQHKKKPAAHLAALLEHVVGQDPFLGRMAAAEILGRGELADHWKRQTRNALIAALTDTAVEPLTKDLLLQIARGGALDDKAIRSAARAVLDSTPPAILSTDIYWPAAIRGLLVALGASGKSEDAQIAEKWIRSDHRAIVETALTVASSLAGQSINQLAERIGEEAFLPPAARQVLRQRARLLTQNQRNSTERIERKYQ